MPQMDPRATLKCLAATIFNDACHGIARRDSAPQGQDQYLSRASTNASAWPPRYAMAGDSMSRAQVRGSMDAPMRSIGRMRSLCRIRHDATGICTDTLQHA